MCMSDLDYKNWVVSRISSSFPFDDLNNAKKLKYFINWVSIFKKNAFSILRGFGCSDVVLFDCANLMFDVVVATVDRDFDEVNRLFSSFVA